MTKQDDTQRKARRDLWLILLILPFAVLCMFVAGQAAIKLAPTWMLPINMFSNLDPNAIFGGPANPFIIEPLDPGILTQPAWENYFLTPNAVYPRSTVVILPTPIPIRNTPQPPPEINTPASPEPTATFIFPPGFTPSGRIFADLEITKTDNSNTYTPGTSISYTITVTNNGPDGAFNFTVEDNIPAVITGLSVNCAPANRCGTNTSSGHNISFENASLTAGAANQLTITVSGVIGSGVTGNLSNSAVVTIPPGSGYSDPNNGNNTNTDTDTRLSIYNLAITKSDGVDTYTATNPINYTIVVANAGPSDAINIGVTDNFPPQIASWSWTCVTPNPTCNGVTDSTANFTDTVTITSGSSLEYAVSAVPSGVPQDISNTASLVIPGGPNQDPVLANNSAIDVDIPYIDLQITKDDGGATFTPGGTVDYTVTVTNNSTFNLTGIGVSDPIPGLIADWTWTCVTPNPTCDGVNSNANFTDTINLTAGSSQVYNVSATVSGSAGLGDIITNTASVSAPTGLVDQMPGDNSATETTPPYIDLAIDKDDFVTTYTQGGSLQYIVTVTNNSGFDLTGITVTDNMPALIGSWSWTCAPDPGPPGSTCTAGPSATNINDTVTILANRSIIYTIDAVVSSTATGDLTNTATVSSGYTDAVPGNNTDDDTDSRYIEYVLGPPDGTITGLPTGTSVDYTLTTPITIDGNTSDYEIVYYERDVGNSIDLDQVIIQISNDGVTWYTVYYWGDNLVDTNASPPGQTNEPDNFNIPSALLYGIPPLQTGILIDADGSPNYPQPPNGTYQFIRVTAPAGDSGDGSDIDTIGVWP